MGQTSVLSIESIGYAGELADFQGMADPVVDTAFNQEAVNQIDFGLMVVRGTVDGSAKLPAAAGDKLIGLSVQSHNFARGVEIDNVTLKLLPGASFGVLVKGRMIVLPASAAAPGDGVHVQVVAEAGFDVGQLRNTASVGKSVNISAFARWLTTAAAAGNPCKLEIDMTNVELATAD